MPAVASFLIKNKKELNIFFCFDQTFMLLFSDFPVYIYYFTILYYLNDNSKLCLAAFAYLNCVFFEPKVTCSSQLEVKPFSVIRLANVR